MRATSKGVRSHGAARTAAAPLTAIRSEADTSARGNEQILKTRHGDIALRQTIGVKLPILFLHGGALCKEVFDRQLESSIGSNYRMIAIDFPGHGGSTDAKDPDRTYSIAGLADLALEVLERLDIDRAVVVGASLGGRIALELIHTFPGLMGIVLTGVPITSSARGSDVRLPEFGLLDSEEPDAARIGSFLKQAVGDAKATQFTSATERADMTALSRIASEIRSNASAWPTAMELKGTPILAVNGENSSVTDTGRESGGRRAQSRFSIPHSGQAPFLDAPVLFNHLVEQFMQRMVRRERQLLAAPPVWYGG